MQQPGGFVDEAFEIKLRNHKTEPATVRVVEHLYRWSNWVITQESAAHSQKDSKTIEYEIAMPEVREIPVRTSKATQGTERQMIVKALEEAEGQVGGPDGARLVWA